MKFNKAEFGGFIKNLTVKNSIVDIPSCFKALDIGEANFVVGRNACWNARATIMALEDDLLLDTVYCMAMDGEFRWIKHSEASQKSTNVFAHLYEILLPLKKLT